MTEQNPYQTPFDAHTHPTNGGARLARDVVLRGSMPMRDVWYSQFLILMRRWPYVVLCLLIYTVFVIVLAMLNRADSLFSSTYLVLGLIVMPGILPLSLLMVYLRLRRDAQRRAGLFAVTESALTQEGIEAAVGRQGIPKMGCVSWIHCFTARRHPVSS